MRLLVLGGSWFVGHAIVSDALRRGWQVTVFNRGRSGSAPSGARLVRGDRDVAGRDAFVSTISAYRDWPHRPVGENSQLWAGDPDHDPGTRAWNPDAYRPLKVGSEIAARRVFSDERLFIVRPHVVLGPGEYVGRLPWWLSRMRRGDRVLVPGPDRPIQPIDVRDLARFTLDQVERGTRGVVNVAAVGRPVHAFVYPPSCGASHGDMLAACAETVADVAERPAEFVWVDENWLVERGVVQWTELPLWRNAAAPWDMGVSKVMAAGLTPRPLAATVADTWEWLRNSGRPVPHERFTEHGIDSDKEAGLLAEWAGLRTRGS